MITDNPGNLLLRGDGAVIARSSATDGPALTLDFLAGYPSDMEPQGADRLDEAADELADARQLQANPDYADRVYGRVLVDGGRKWLQYWLWLYYNPKHLLGFGRHEGDWELVQIALGALQEPELVTFAQHSAGENRAWSEVEHHSSPDGVHPVVYVAPLSHASYFEAGTHFYLFPLGADSPDGAGPAVLPQLEFFGAWVEWPGRWGNSEGVLGDWARGRLGGRSPTGPAHQGDKWRSPSRFHERVKRRAAERSLAGVGGPLWKLGKRTYPPAPTAIDAHLKGASVVVEYRLSEKPIRPSRQLWITVHTDDQAQATLTSRVVRVTSAKGSETLPLPLSPDTCLVRASAFNRLRQRSDLAEVRAEGAGSEAP